MLGKDHLQICISKYTIITHTFDIQQLSGMNSIEII